MSGMLRSVWYAAMRWGGANAIARAVRGGGLVLCYHNVIRDRPAYGEASLHVTAAEFAWQVSWLRRAYDLVSLTDLATAAADGRASGLAAITFDDGYAGVLEHAIPLLAADAIPATVFVLGDPPTRTGFWWDQVAAARQLDEAQRESWLDHLRGDATAIWDAAGLPEAAAAPASYRPATWDQLRGLAAPHVSIGGHSMTHRNLTRLTSDELTWEIGQCHAVIAEQLGTAPSYFAFPYGLWNATTRDAVLTAGFEGSVTLDEGLNRAGQDPFTLRRVNVPASLSRTAFTAWASGLRPGRR